MTACCSSRPLRTRDHHVERPDVQTRADVVFSSTREDLGWTKEGTFSSMCYYYILANRVHLGRLGLREFWKILDPKNDPKSFKGLTYI